MPVSHALETIQGVLIDRLDGRLEAVAALVHEHLTDHMDADACERLAIKLIQDLQVTFFPSAFGYGEQYQPDPAGRMERVADWLPRVPMLSIYARHLIEAEREKAAGKLRMPDGSALLADADLVRLASRREARESRAVAV
jgi:hypothetical protein